MTKTPDGASGVLSRYKLIFGFTLLARGFDLFRYFYGIHDKYRGSTFQRNRA